MDNDMPLGACPKCQKMGLINREGVKICPACDTNPGTRSGLVNRVKDPGDRMDANGKITGAIEFVEPSLKESRQEIVEERQRLSHIQMEPIDEVSESIDCIDRVLLNMRLSDFADLREARKVVKYRKKLATLKIELQEFLG